MWYITIDTSTGRTRYRCQTPVSPLAMAVEDALHKHNLQSSISGSYQITVTESHTPPVNWENDDE